MTPTAHRRARCGVCNCLCEQSSTTLLVGGRRVAAWRCAECLAVSPDERTGECPLCASALVVHRIVRDPSGAELPATDCTDCEQVCLAAAFAGTDAERGAWKRAADDVAAKYSQQAHADMERAKAAEARIAELVREVREWYDGQKDGTLNDILIKFEVKS